MELQRLKYFLEVARQKHFSRAAEVCRVSQPSLSQQIKKLESEVGGRLFQRSRGEVSLTPLGQQFLKHAQAILADVQSAEEFIHKVQDEHERTLRFGAIPTLAPYLIPHLFTAVRAQAPGVRFELYEAITEQLTEALMMGRIDFALLSPPTSMDEECDSILLLKDELFLTLPEHHALTRAPSVSADQIAEQAMILLEDSHCLAAQTGAYCKELGLSPSVALRSSQIDTLLGLVETGCGLAFTPALAAHAHQHRKVVFRPICDLPCHREVRLMWLKRQFLSRSQRLVVRAMQDCDFSALVKT